MVCGGKRYRRLKVKILSRKDIEKIAERVLKAYKNLPENINTDITHIDAVLQSVSKLHPQAISSIHKGFHL